MTNPARSRSPSLPRSRSSNGSNARLEPPPVSRAPEDPEVAQSAQPQSQSQSRSQSRPGSPYDNDTGRARSTTPVPRTRVERLDSEPSYGEAPGSPAYEKRRLDAVPDQVIVRSRSASQDGRAGDSTAQLSAPPRPPSSTSLASVPRTVVEKVDTATPSYGEDPTSPAYKARLADAAPDYIFQSDGQSHVSEVLTQEPESTGEGPTTAPIAVPETRVSRVDTLPTREKTRILHKRNPSDAEPDVVETASQTDSGRLTNADSPSPSRSGTADAQPTFGQLTMPPPPPPAPSADESEEYDSEEDDNTEEPADAEGSGAAVVNSPPVPQSTVEVSQNVQQTPPENPAPIFVDFDQLDSLSDLIDIWQPDLDTLFPQSKDVESYPPVPPMHRFPPRS
ncbi:hypothetical protein KEM52_002511 [Ascosphaera acerosa]|nr:hypothetical protein KEM52_002511 [Ascosphaera acerosa]